MRSAPPKARRPLLCERGGRLAGVGRLREQAVGEALERGLDPERDDALDEVMRILRDVARTDATTGAEAELDLQAMETMSSIRLNSMGILGYWRRTRKAEGAGQAS